VPILTECPNWFVGTVLERLPLGDHVGFVLDPQEVQLEVPQAEFTFHRARRVGARGGQRSTARFSPTGWSTSSSSPSPRSSAVGLTR